MRFRLFIPLFLQFSCVLFGIKLIFPHRISCLFCHFPVIELLYFRSLSVAFSLLICHFLLRFIVHYYLIVFTFAAPFQLNFMLIFTDLTQFLSRFFIILYHFFFIFIIRSGGFSALFFKENRKKQKLHCRKQAEKASVLFEIQRTFRPSEADM